MMQNHLGRFLLPAAILFCAIPCLAVFGQAVDTRPVEGIRTAPNTCHAFTGARIVLAPARVVEEGTLLIREGVIVAVGANVEIPAEAEIHDLAGKTIYPGLIDPFSEADAQLPADAGAGYWNNYITPQLAMSRWYRADAKADEAYRKAGIVARLIAPKQGIVKGVSVVAATNGESGSQALLHESAALHVRPTLPFGSGRSRDSFPDSPMGAVALLRQTFYDAQWLHEARRAYEADATLPRPEQNEALTALQPYLERGGLVVFDAPNERFCLRSDLLAREFNLKIALRGSGREYRRLEEIAALGRPLIVPVDFPKAPNVATPEAARQVSLEGLMHWKLAPENPARVEAAGVSMSLTAFGLKDAGSYLASLRTAVERGLAADDALRAVTERPAELLGVERKLGSLAAGKAASFLITNGPLFEKKTKLLETWVEGRQFVIVEPPADDLRGTWQLTAQSPEGKPVTWELELTGEVEKLAGVVRPKGAKAGDAKEAKLLSVERRRQQLSGSFEGKPLGVEGVFTWSLVLAEEIEGPRTAQGRIVWPSGVTAELTASRIATTEPKEEKPAAEAKPNEEKPAEKEKSPEVNFPLGAYGVSKYPARQQVLFRGGTVWTCGPAGRLAEADVLIAEGLIVAVGPNLTAPKGCVVIDCRGKHLAPGIIDCHSHMATDGGVNEGTQAITAEVRIGDFIDDADINIYRQLAGGVTAANILHGSANPIGGQNQVIKLRWGLSGEGMKFREAPPGIKFALGENVKQSNWGERFTTRYPQTRMGVEQIVRDAFDAARRYELEHRQWRIERRGLPPRRDLELEALAEILRHERWIHCHSYRQDEILALLRTLEDLGITIGTLQHILEGYKVADAMAAHGAMGSSFSDWWAYKFEVIDSIPYNGALMHRAGVVVSFNSDDAELARHLNHEAAKAVKYGGVPEEEALKFVTLNPARQLRIDRYVGSLEAGKQADVVVWSGPPLSTLSRCEQTWVDGRPCFSIEDDLARREAARTLHARLVQEILRGGVPMAKPGETQEGDDDSGMWPRNDNYCIHTIHNGGGRR